MNDKNIVLYDSLKNLKVYGTYKGSIISKFDENSSSIIFSDNIDILENGGIKISQGLMVGFEKIANRQSAFSKKSDFFWDKLEDSPIEYVLLISDNIMEQYDEGHLTTNPYTITMLHTAGLYLINSEGYQINHLDFFQGENLKNPIGLISDGIFMADRVVIDHRGDPVFYGCLIIGRDEDENLSASYEPLINVKMDDKIVKFIIIMGVEILK